MGEDDIFDIEDYSIEAEAIVTSASLKADVRRKIEDHLERLRLKKLIQDYDFDM